MCTFGVLGLSCETPAEKKKREILGPPPSGPHPSSPRAKNKTRQFSKSRRRLGFGEG